MTENRVPIEMPSTRAGTLMFDLLAQARIPDDERRRMQALIAKIESEQPAPPLEGMHGGDHECRRCGLSFPLEQPAPPLDVIDCGICGKRVAEAVCIDCYQRQPEPPDIGYIRAFDDPPEAEAEEATWD